MNKSGALEQFATNCGGILLAHEAVANGFSRENLRQAVKKGVLENIAYGVYATKETFPDYPYILQRLYRNIVFSHETAGFFLNHTTRDPIVYCATVPSGHNSKLLRESMVKLYYAKDICDADIVEAKTMYGRTVRCFNIEKTICDLCSPRFDGDKDVALEIIKSYARSKSKDVVKLLSYASTESVKKTIRGYMEVLF